MMMIKFLAIWLADRCGLFEETEAAANAYLQSKSAYESAEEGWRSRLEEAKKDVEFYRGITARDLGFQRMIAEKIGCLDDSLTLTDQQVKTMQYITEIADGLAIRGFNDRAFLTKLVKILVRPNADCDATSIDVLQSTVIDAVEKLKAENDHKAQALLNIADISAEFGSDFDEKLLGEIEDWKTQSEQWESQSKMWQNRRSEDIARLQDLMQAQRSAWENGAVNQQLRNLAESQESLFEHLESISHAVGLNPKTKDGKSIDVPAILAKIDEYKKPKPLALGGASGAISVRHLAPNQGL
jgi:hypothetical protein